MIVEEIKQMRETFCRISNGKFKCLIENTRKYLDYVENHYDNVQKAFKEFSRRIASEKGAKKYSEFIWQTKLYHGYWYFFLKAIIENHDLSKLGKEEFTAYRDNFFPINEKAKEENEENFNKARKHHKQNNDHHWQSRVDKTVNGYLDYASDYFAIENAMDWIAMAYTFNETPINKYYLENKHKIQLSERDTMIIETVYNIMLDEELGEKQ